MNKINRKLEYALIALKHMKTRAPGELSTAKEISQHFNMPFDATARVMQILAQKGILKSEQGVNGGYQIVKDLSKLSLGDLMSFILGPLHLAKCLHKGNNVHDACEILEQCSIMSPMANLNRKLNDFYASINLAELLDPKAIKSESFAEVRPYGH